MAILIKQIEEFSNELRRFVYAFEEIVASGEVKKRIGMIGIRTGSVKLLVTNFPRLLIVDPVSLVLKEQVSWGANVPMVFAKVFHDNSHISNWRRF